MGVDRDLKKVVHLKYLKTDSNACMHAAAAAGGTPRVNPFSAAGIGAVNIASAAHMPVVDARTTSAVHIPGLYLEVTLLLKTAASLHRLQDVSGV